MKRKPYTLTLDSLDVMQVLDALESRAEAYEKTAEYLEGKPVDIIVEEVSDREEALEIAAQFREIMETIQSQIPSRPDLAP